MNMRERENVPQPTSLFQEYNQNQHQESQTVVDLREEGYNSRDSWKGYGDDEYRGVFGHMNNLHAQRIKRKTQMYSEPFRNVMLPDDIYTGME